jgi:uncharacterized membrane protein YccC
MSMAATPRVVREAIRFDRGGLQIVRGVRFAVGVGVPLFIGVATGRIVEGVAISVGAALVGLTDSGAPYRSRVPAMLGAAIGAAVSTFVGEVTGSYDVIAVVLLTLWSFAAGMFIAISVAAYFVALTSPLAMTLVASFPADAVHSLEHAAVVFAGGMFAIALVLVLWRAHAHLPERTAVAKLYRALAAWVRDPHQADDRAPVLLALRAARDAVDAAEGRVAVASPAGEAFRALVDEADRTLLDMVALRNARKTIETWDPRLAASAFEPARAAAADALIAVADALEACRWRADVDSIRSRLDASVTAIRGELEHRRATGNVDHVGELEAVLHRGASVRGELRSVVDLAASWQGEGAPPEDPVRHESPRRAELGVRSPWPVLRANLAPQSNAFRHAARLSITIAIAATVYRVFDLPRGYWVPLTVFFVLRPDFGSTFTRGLQRYAGTALGAVLATLIAATFNPGPYALAALSTLLAVGIFAFLYANYGLFTVSMTAWIIFVVAFAGIPEATTAIDRLLDTTIGATLTLAVYGLWPSWERSKLPDTTAALIEGDRAYLRSVFESWLNQRAGETEAVRTARTQARIARTNAEASLQRALFEPGRNRVGFGTADATGILASLRRFADGALALEAHFEEDKPAAPPEARALADELDTALAELASAARDRRAPKPLPPLRETQQALAVRVGREAPLSEETDRIVNSVTVAAHVLAACRS